MTMMTMTTMITINSTGEESTLLYDLVEVKPPHGWVVFAFTFAFIWITYM